MCLITEETVKYADGYSEIKKVLHTCHNSVNKHPCNDLRTETSEERVPGSSSQLVRHPSSSRHDQLVLHQDPPRRRQEPREERHYASEIGVRLRGWFPEFSIRRLDNEGIGSRRRRGHGESRRASGEVMPEAPMPPPPTFIHQSNRRSPPPSAMPALVTSPNRPTPPQGPGAAAVAYTTRDTIPSSSGTPSRTSSTRSRDAHRAVQDLPLLTIPGGDSSVTSSRHPRPTPGLSRLRFDSSTKFNDSTYGGSSNISPIEAPKTDTLSETHSNTTSGRSASQRYNYTNDNAVVGRRDYDTDDEDKKSNSSEGRKSYRIIRRVRGNDDPEMTQRKMLEDTRAAEEYQSQMSEQGDGSVGSGSGSRRRRHHRR
ncbi:unnamed protein product [Aureobasidium mustum]|uniref:Uncharacterized protein n=1 Tax=Aureobasidium mustum TaxID=2773714 RepID=A0A9N8JNU2_9PEZI|nr:unnamed protein product [Aureobasidium mustum]